MKKSQGLKLISIIGFVLVVMANNVIVKLSPVDLQLLGDDLEAYKNFQIKSFEDELEFVSLVQNYVLSISPGDEGIGLYQRRGLYELHKAGQGLCYDRSYVIECLLKHKGLDIRHVAIFRDDTAISTFQELTSPKTSSHALTEVKTSRGWMLVDSNTDWIGYKNDTVFSYTSIIESDDFITDPPHSLLGGKHHYLYGVYSRHGKFYWPYWPIPDYNLNQLIFNL